MADEAPGGTDTGDVTPPATEDNAKTQAGGGEAKDWRLSLPEDLRANPSLSKFSSVEALAKSYVNASSMIGRDKVPVPKDGEDWSAWFKAAGRPDDPKEYEFKVPDGIPAESYSKESADWFRDVAHKAGLNRPQAQAIHDTFVAAFVEGENAKAEQIEASRLAAEEALKKEWGAAFQRKMEAAGAVAAELGGEEFGQFLVESNLGNDPRLIRVMARVAEMTKGDTGLVGKGGDGAMTPAELDIAIARHWETNKAALLDKQHPAHDALVKERARMFAQRHPEKAQA